MIGEIKLRNANDIIAGDYSPAVVNERTRRSAPGAVTGPIAFVMSNAIGDTLVSMVIVRNLIRNGVEVTVFGRPAFALREWFPDVVIEPLPEHDTAWVARLAGFQRVLQMQRLQPIARLHEYHPAVMSLHEVEFGEHPGCMAERFADFCRRELRLSDVTLDTGITPPAGLRHRHFMKRVAIHPEASTAEKRWFQARFYRLAHRLRQRGYDVHFVIAPSERMRWRALDAHGISAPHFANLHELASWLYESGWFIGSDSGIGHLASNLRIPTVSLFRRRGVARRWRPAWGDVRVVLSWQWVPTSFLKERLWRHTLTCTRVLSTFLRQVRQEQQGGAAKRGIAVDARGRLSRDER